ncbi:hypothetical protein SAMN05216276_107911 [Streptosporangium subroseum]|uniref:Uncharacterized protein n=1 Tax=Streptosporangium subroseum TaxID=106412 RepID=A0A239P0S5_9ACTN|nr:hypothetical protein SAMN05216276_107911 [Streptosporangium subroseum]
MPLIGEDVLTSAAAGHFDAGSPRYEKAGLSGGTGFEAGRFHDGPAFGRTRKDYRSVSRIRRAAS